jgi:hypothetical protein
VRGDLADELGQALHGMLHGGSLPSTALVSPETRRRRVCVCLSLCVCALSVRAAASCARELGW